MRTLTESEIAQNELNDSIQEIYHQRNDLSEVELYREKHINYLKKGFLRGFSSSYVSLDSSRPWLIYWSLQSFDLLGYDVSDSFERILDSLEKFKVGGGEGGFGGSDHELSGHFAHLAPTFAVISSIAILAHPRAYSLIDRPALKSLLNRLKTSDGAFRMHALDGEIDVRAVYCAVVVGKLTGCWDEGLEEGVLEWICRCQTWEGGFGGVPGAEAHGGYTYCALATLNLLNSTSDLSPHINTSNLMYWLTAQQVQGVGGFRGRTNKLVDGCYSFWQAAAFELIGMGKLVDSVALQQFILLACQDEIKGGLRDKPEKNVDFYHTCYCLSGLSVAQHQIPDPDFILGGPTNLLKSTDVRFNLVKGKAEAMANYFGIIL